MASVIRGVDNFDSSDNATQTELDNVDTSADAIGVGQTWQDVSGSRSLSTTYTNSTGKPILVAVSGYGNVFSNIYIASYVDGNLLQEASVGLNGDGSVRNNLTWLVPDGSTYSATVSGSTTITVWKELR